MRRMALLLAVAAVLAVASQASADPLKVNCPNGTDWAGMTVNDAAALIWPKLLDQSPWSGQNDFRDSVVAPRDKNTDGLVCVKTNQQANPNGNWIDFPLFLLRDNSANAG